VMEDRTNDSQDREEGRKSQQQDSSQPSSQREPLGASHEQNALGGSVTAAGGSSTGPGAGQAGTDRSPGFIGSEDEDHDPQQAGFAQQGRGAPDDGGDIERGTERTDNFDSDVEGSSNR
jgi:hypothetical protein